jgi:hypothetical protein
MLLWASSNTSARVGTRSVAGSSSDAETFADCAMCHGTHVRDGRWTRHTHLLRTGGRLGARHCGHGLRLGVVAVAHGDGGAVAPPPADVCRMAAMCGVPVQRGEELRCSVRQGEGAAVGQRECAATRSRDSRMW